jgi:hypothetical protein
MPVTLKIVVSWIPLLAIVFWRLRAGLAASMGIRFRIAIANCLSGRKSPARAGLSGLRQVKISRAYASGS